MQDQPMSAQTPSVQFQLFILRVWQETPDGPLRYILKATDDNQRHVFADVQSLADFLAQVTIGTEGESH